MADQPPPSYSSIYSKTPSSEPPQCSCHNNPLLTRQQCPRCINQPNTNVQWMPPSGYHAPDIGFRPPAPPPSYSLNPPAPPSSYPQKPPASYSHNPPPPSSYPSNPPPPPPPTPSSQCSSCCTCKSCSGSTLDYRPKPVEFSNQFGPPKGGIRPYYWVDTFAHGGVPTTALRGGHDIDGSPIYVGRAFHEGDWIPAKVIPDKHVAYVPYNGVEHAKGQYQVLCEQRFDWVPSTGGHVPPGAVEGGKTSDGETLYVGRVHHDGAVTVGKVHPSHGVCYVPFDGRENGHDSYEILVLRN